MNRATGAALLLLSISFLTGCSSNSQSGSTTSPSSAENKVLHIAWAQWKPSDYLQTLSKEFTKKTGIKVVVDQIPWTNYQQKIETDVWAGKSDAYDLIVGDSQWLGIGAADHQYVDLTDWSKTNVPWQDYSDNIKHFYCEYNGKIWALPCEADAIGFAYRKDLFNNPQEQANFKAKYGYPLAPPTTWKQFADIAQFFTRPQQHLYGTALFYAGPSTYDGVTMGFMQTLWCLGGDLYNQQTHQIEGVVNSPASVQALSFYAQQLKQYCPPGSENFYYNETLQAFKSGQVAMAMDWYTFFPALTDPKQNPFAPNTGFFVSPAGPAGHYISLGGQGISVSAYSKHIDWAEQFLQWFSSEAVQKQWATMGGLTCNTSILKSAAFQNATPFNAEFAASVPYLRDYWNNTAYARLLNITQTEWNAAASGTETPQKAMDNVAKQQTQVMQENHLTQY